MIPPQRLNLLNICIFMALASPVLHCHASDTVEFNTNILDIQDEENISLEQFSRAGYIMPGEYRMIFNINKTELPEMPVAWIVPPDDEKGSEVCLSPEVMSQLGLKPDVLEKMTYWHDNQCADLSLLAGTVIRADLASSTLYLSIPQAYVEYSTPDWDPPSRWDDGIPGVMFDYGISANHNAPKQTSSSTDASGNGIVGINVGPWRIRANWQAQYRQTNSGSTQSWDWSQYYAYRALPDWGAKLTIGETYLDTDIFDSLRITGLSVRSDDKQLPPNLRGYAPEVSGIARTNAKVSVSQQGRLLYESQVPQGPFLIQNLQEAIAGKLQVRVEEQDGSVQEFEIDTATIPYLSRPGQIRFKASMGLPSDSQHKMEGDAFYTGEASWGVANGWSLYGGALTDGNYKSAAMGLGRDLLMLGAISLDATQSYATLPVSGVKTGGSYKVSYSKRFEEYDTQVTFAGYRFSQRNFMGPTQYLDYKKNDNGQGTDSNKQLYTVTLNKQFREAGIGAYINYSHQTYWNSPQTDRWNISMSRYFSVGNFNNISVNISAFRNISRGIKDDGFYLSTSIPFGQRGSLSYNLQGSKGRSAHSASWYERLDKNNTYQVTATTSSGSQPGVSGYYSWLSDTAQFNASAGYRQDEYSSFGLSAQGGLTATLEGAAAHRTNMAGGTRLMVDTEGVGGVPVEGNGAPSRTNMFGKAVINDVNSYYRSTARIDVNGLADDVETDRPSAQITLTEGAIGYRKFGIISGKKLMAQIRLANGSAPPFGASVVSKGRETGIVDDGGSVWLSGITPGIKMDVRWDGGTKCSITLPEHFNDTPTEQTELLLPCV